MNNGKICVSVCAETAEDFKLKIKRAEKIGDLIELRFDCLKKEEITSLEPIFSKLNEKYIFTFRPKEQGGKREISIEDRQKFWKEGFKFCVADLEEDVLEISRHWNYQYVICSFHDFKQIPSDIVEIYERLKTTEPQIIKIAVRPKEISETVKIWKLLTKANLENTKLIPIGMGEAGKWTRILGLAHGSPITYASLEEGSETAPGQISARDLKDVYRVKELNKETKIYGVIGNPVSHSLSPYMHNAAFKHHRLNSVYIPLEVSDLKKFITKMVRQESREIEWNLKGFSVTIPHKEPIIKYLDHIDEDAQAIGAVNTVHLVNGRLHGYNTDAKGFIDPLLNSYGSLQNTKVGIIGNGGAARACIYGLQKEGADITIFARNPQKAQSLTREFNVDLEDLATQKPKINKQHILVNTTPLGTIGELENVTPVFGEQMKSLHMVYDLVYNPFETKFIREAKKVHVPTLGGLAMLVAQGMEQFKIWTGLDAPMQEMSRAALQKLK